MSAALGPPPAAGDILSLQNGGQGNTGGALQVVDGFGRLCGLILNGFSSTKTLLNAITSYNGVATAGLGVPAIYANGRLTALVAASGTVATYNVGAADSSFLVSANVNLTAVTTASFTVTVAYTDETNASRALVLTFSETGGTLVQTITNTTGAGAYTGLPQHIRCKAGTTITIQSSAGGTYTTVTFNIEAYITQIG